ncbi:MAG: hypothetical protein ACLGGV_00475 [Bacteroidia bacterium]
MKRCLFLILFFSGFHFAYSQEYYSLGTYKNSFSLERTRYTTNLDYGRILFPARKIELSANGGVALSGSVGFRAYFSTRYVITTNREHRLLNRLGYVSAINESVGVSIENKDWFFVSLGYEYFPKRKVGISFSLYQLLRNFNDLERKPDASLGVLLMF